MTPWNLSFFSSGEWDVCREHLDDLAKAGTVFSPSRNRMFHSLAGHKPEDIRVVVFGQDPYPDPKYSTGIAFHIPGTFRPVEFPPTLTTLLKEYSDDLHYPSPTRGDLSSWSNDGVLLWNCIPICCAWRSLSCDWPEWEILNKNLIDKLETESRCTFVFIGAKARRYAKYVQSDLSEIVEVGHPSPRNKTKPFLGSRMFTKVNEKLVKQGLPIINWRLPDGSEIQAPKRNEASRVPAVVSGTGGLAPVAKAAVPA